MGSSQSHSRLTHDTVIKSTKDTRVLVDEIFRFMQREINIRDFYKLSVPAECDKYIVIMTNFLDTLFSRLQLIPIKNKAGVLYFRKIDDFKKDEKIQSERRAGCILLSYFYIRILQIYGALALTIIDEAQQFAPLIEGQGVAPYTSRLAIGFQNGGGDGNRNRNNNGIVYRDPAAVAAAATVPAPAPTIPVGPMTFAPIPTAATGYYYPPPSTISGVLPGQTFTFKEEPLSVLNALGPKYKASNSKTIIFNNISKFFLKNTESELNLFGTRPFISEEQRIRASELKKFLNIQYDISGDIFQDKETQLSLELEKSETSNKTGRIYMKIIDTSIGTRDTIKELSIGLSLRGYTSEEGNTSDLGIETSEEGKETQAQRGKIRVRISNVTISNSPIVNYSPEKLSAQRFIIKDKMGVYKVQKFTEFFTMRTFDDFIKKILYLVLLDTKIISILYPGKISKKEVEVVYREAGVIPELDIAELLNILQKPKKPRPYCISRALQLLTTVPTNNEKYTNMCVRDFKEFGVEQSFYEKSVPLRGQELSTITSLSALETLFKDTFEFVRAADNKSFSLEFRRSQPSIDIYRDFLIKMIRLFAGIAPESVQQIGKIKDMRSEVRCADAKMDRKITLRTEQIKRLKPGVQSAIMRLFQTQIQHTAKVGKLLQKLFMRRKLATGEMGIFLHPDLLNKGFIYLQGLNKDAYSLLVDYYTTCETIYSEGQGVMIDSLKENVVSEIRKDAAPAPAPAPK